ncbi:arylsulfatase [Parapedobacter soli]|uniref:arylsulfatase n=1 Tax=Parapedobacter soli TaxID=416955 RepID=UPI0021C98E74|nr:arylsulfatase [Parapedobacter soli]
MNRMTGIGLLIAFLLLAGGMLRAAAQQTDKPNIVFILADDLGYGSIGAFGQQLIQTPNLDRLAQNGMVLTDFYANAVCAPTRGSLITGMHTGDGLVRGNMELGTFDNAEEFGQLPLPANILTMGTTLQAAGYTTAIIGKWGLGGPGSTGEPHRQGFDFFYGYLDQKQAHNYYPDHLWRNGVRESLPGALASAHQKLPEGADPNDPATYERYRGSIYSCDTMTAEAVRFIRNHRDRPFFLEMAYTLPHMALQVPERALTPYRGKFDKKPFTGPGYLPNRTPRETYAAMITLLDDYVGQLVQALEENGLINNTLIVFTSDNGAATGGGADPDFFDASGGLRGRKGSLHEGGIRVPFVAAWPGKIPAGSRSDHPLAIWDLLPTFLDAGGSAVPQGINGISFWPVLSGNPALQQGRTFLYWEFMERSGEQAVRFGRWKAIRKDMRVHKWDSPIELYDLQTDRAEQHNVAARYPELVRRAAQYLATRKRADLPAWNPDTPENLL